MLLRSVTNQAIAIAVELDPADAAVLVGDPVHRRDVVEPADDVGRPEGLAGLHRPAVQFLDEADVAALVAPRLGHRRGVERHAGQPRPRLAVELHLIGPDHPLGNPCRPAPVEELLRRGRSRRGIRAAGIGLSR